MAKEVLLINDVAGLGAQGDVVNVADGYARNYLFPRNLAAAVTDVAKRKIASLRKDGELKRVAVIAASKDLVAKLEKASCTITVKANEAKDKLFGSVTTADIAAALKAQGIEIDKHCIVLDQPIKELGVFNLKIKLPAEVEGAVRVWVVEE